MKKLLLALPAIFALAIGAGVATAPKKVQASTEVGQCTCIYMPIYGCVSYSCSLPNQWSCCTGDTANLNPGPNETLLYTAPYYGGTCIHVPNASWVPALGDFGLDNVFHSLKTGTNSKIDYYADPNFTGNHYLYTQNRRETYAPVGNGMTSLVVVAP